MQIQIESKQLEAMEKVLENLGQDARPLLSKSINRAAKSIPMDASKKARETYNIKSTQIKGKFKVDRANKSNLLASVTAKGEPISLYHFNPRPTKPQGGRSKGVSIKVKNTRKMLPGAFIGTLAAGGDPANKARSSHAVFMRVPGKYMNKRVEKTKHTQYVRKLNTLSIPQMIDNDDVVEAVEDGAGKRFTKNLEHEIDYYFQKKGLK